MMLIFMSVNCLPRMCPHRDRSLIFSLLHHRASLEQGSQNSEGTCDSTVSSTSAFQEVPQAASFEWLGALVETDDKHMRTLTYGQEMLYGLGLNRHPQCLMKREETISWTQPWRLLMLRCGLKDRDDSGSLCNLWGTYSGFYILPGAPHGQSQSILTTLWRIKSCP